MWQLVEKENSELKPVKLCLKIDLVSRPTCVEGLVITLIELIIEVELRMGKYVTPNITVWNLTGIKHGSERVSVYIGRHWISQKKSLK